MRIEARNITLSYGARVALDCVSATLEAGETIGLIGPNGAGKTTFLRALAGLATPAEGELFYDGAPSTTVARQDLARRVAYLAQGGRRSGRFPSKRSSRSAACRIAALFRRRANAIAKPSSARSPPPSFSN